MLDLFTNLAETANNAVLTLFRGLHIYSLYVMILVCLLYTSSILNSGASSTAVSYFSANLDVGNTLEQSATEYIDSYSYKEKTTTWIIDNDGKVVVSSSGFAIEKQEMPDYEEALASDSNKDVYKRQYMYLVKFAAVKDITGKRLKLNLRANQFLMYLR